LDIWEYFLQKEREFSDAGGVPEEPPSEIFRADPGSDDARGRVRATLRLAGAADAYVEVYERVLVVDSRYTTREVYSYALVIDGTHVRGWERDPAHDDSPVHEHYGSERKRERHTQPISLKRALEICWEEVSLHAEAPLEDA
jgi:hypothetical protein